MEHLERRQSYGAISRDNLHNSTNSTSSSSIYSSSTGLSQAQVVGIIVAILIVTIASIIATYYFCMKSKRRKDAERNDTMNASSQAYLQSHYNNSYRSSNCSSSMPNITKSFSADSDLTMQVEYKEHPSSQDKQHPVSQDYFTAISLPTSAHFQQGQPLNH